MPSADESSACFDKAVELLALRPHFRRQLEHKLSRRGFSASAIEMTCARLEARGYLDDLSCARSLASGQLRRKGYGPRRLRAELRRRGAGENVVDLVVEEELREGEAPLAHRVAADWLRRNAWDRRRLARHLDRKGFTSGSILSVLEDLRGDADEAPADDSD